MEDLSPSRFVALLPFAVGPGSISSRQIDLCRGFSCFLERHIAKLAGVESVLQHGASASDTPQDRRSGGARAGLWSLEQVLALPHPEHATHLLQGAARWANDKWEIELELIDLEAEAPILHERVAGHPETAFDDLFGLLGEMGNVLLGGAAQGRLLGRKPTNSPDAFADYLIGLSSIQGFALSILPAEAAAMALGRALQADPEFREAAECLELLAALCLERDDLDGAVRILERGRNLQPGQPRFLALLGMTQLRRDNPAEAKVLLAEFLEKENRGELATQAMTLLARLVREAEPDRAFALLRRAAALNPESVAAQEDLANMHAGRGDWRAAEACWRRALQEDPNRPESLLHLSLAHFRRRDYRGARPLLERAVEHPERPQAAWSLLVEALVQLRDFAAADDAATAWAEEHADSFGAWAKLAMVRRKRGDAAAAAMCLDRASVLASKEDERELVRMERVVGERPELLEDLRLVFPTAKVSESRGRLAIRRLKSAVEKWPDVGSLWSALAEFHAAIFDWPGAAEAQRRAAELWTANASAQASHGKYLAKAGQFAEALVAFKAALALDENSAEYWLSVGFCHAKLGDADAAIEHFERSLALRPDSETAKTLLDRERRRREAPSVPEPAVAETPEPVGFLTGLIESLRQVFTRKKNR